MSKRLHFARCAVVLIAASCRSSAVLDKAVGMLAENGLMPWGNND